jgi:hypothetical protein
MRTATFWSNHIESDSRVWFEFGLIDKKVKLTATLFVRGNVVNLSSYKKCKQEAKEVLA